MKNPKPLIIALLTEMGGNYLYSQSFAELKLKYLDPEASNTNVQKERDQYISQHARCAAKLEQINTCIDWLKKEENESDNTKETETKSN